MPPRRLPETGLADLVQVVHALRPGTADLDAAAEMLGLVRPARHAAPDVSRAGRGGPAAWRGTSPRPPPGFADESLAPAGDVGSVPAIADYRLPSSQLAPDQPAARLADLLPEGDRPVPLAGLLAPGQARALLTHLASRMRPDGDFDGLRAVELLARGEPLLDLPRLWVETTRGGTELALDIGQGMQPFRSDLDLLPRQLGVVIGRGNLRTRWFQDCPVGGEGVYVPGSIDPVRYQLPSPGTLIVAVTSFGVCGAMPAPRAVIGRWHRLLAAARQAGTPLIALTPLPERRRPPELPRQLPVVSWDRTSTVRDVAHAVQSRARVRAARDAGAR